MGKKNLAPVDLAEGSTTPTAAPGDNSTKVASTAFVAAAVAGAGGGGGISWSTVNANTSMTAGKGYNVTGARDMTLPASVSAGQQFAVHAVDDQVRIVSNGNVIDGVGSGNNLLLRAGETAYLVGTSTGNLEIV